MLTLKNLKDLEPHAIIDSGVTIDNYTGINMSGSNRVLRWVAVRGGIHDWAIYIGFAEEDENAISRHGDKVYGKENIQKLVPCDNESFKMYRY
jgi:hypothetical protein